MIFSSNFQMGGMMNIRLIVLATMLLILSSVAFAEQAQITAAYVDGEAQAKQDVSSALWMGVGCVTGGFSWLYPEVFPSNAVPQVKLIGKAPEYVAGYTDGYSRERKHIIQKNSCIGGSVYWGCCVVYYVAAIASASNEASNND
jgi:hypothetical protein